MQTCPLGHSDLDITPLGFGAWALRPEVTGAVVGAPNAGQIDGLIHGADFKLTPAKIAEIKG